MPNATPSVVFLCIQNAGRSQMAAAWARHFGGEALEVTSGGSTPAAAVHPNVVETMADVGIDVAGERPRRWELSDLEAADAVITMGCGDECPVVPGVRYEDWEIEDPSGRPAAAVAAIRDDIRNRVQHLLTDLGVTNEEPA